MTPGELRLLADEAMRTELLDVDARGVFVATAVETDQAQARRTLDALAPGLARLCAELGEALAEACECACLRSHGAISRCRRCYTLAKLSELKLHA